MATSDLIQSVLTTPGFMRQLRAVTVESVSRQFPTMRAPLSLFSEQHDWPYLLMCATLLAQSTRGAAQDAALRIAHHGLSLSPLDDRIVSAAVVTLDMLTNQPAIQLAMERGLVRSDYLEFIPLPLRLDWIQRAVRYFIVLGNNKIVHANRFQRSFWDDVEVTDWLSVSAPTSAGKSFLLVNWLAEYLRNREKVLIVYVVPTRALIQQVQLDLELHFAENAFRQVKVSCLPLSAQINTNGHTVFVLTQERLHILLNNLHEGPRLDLLVVDEAQKVGDGARGVLLQTVIESVATHSPEAKFVFASPTTDNPEALLDDAPTNRRKKGFRSEQVTVNQNLLWVSAIPLHPKQWKVELCIKDDKVQLGEILLAQRPGVSPPKRLAFVAHEMGRAAGKDVGGNLVYVNGPADAEKVAQLLYGLVGKDADISQLKPISDLSALIKKVIHPQYALATVINRGIAFHYGNMPLLIRNEIEKLFKDNTIRFLVCTSTLVEGVNLPAKSIFVRGPDKGKGIPMSEADFWNLAGRAGRMGKEFQGNVVCIDPYDRTAWPEPPPTERRTQKIERATDSVLGDGDKFLKYLSGDLTITDKRSLPKYEHVLGYLFGHVFRHGSLHNSGLVSRYSAELIGRLDAILVDAKDGLRTPQSIVQRNPGINPLAMDKLLKHFEEYKKPIESLFLKYPEENDASGSVIAAFTRINNSLAPATMPFGSVPNRVIAMGILVVDWMQGHPLARLISKQVALQKKAIEKAAAKGTPSKKISLAATIRNTMEDVERVARFLAPKYVSCYTDILRQFLVSSGRQELAAVLPDLTLWLEFGASQQTQLSLMALGLSRTAAISLSEFIPAEDFDEAACIEWFHETDFQTLDLPALIVQEIERVKQVTRPSDDQPPNDSGDSLQ